MKIFILFLTVAIFGFATPKVLHITFHRGCAGEVESLCDHFGFDVDTWLLSEQKSGEFDPESSYKKCYIMTHERADRIFKAHKDKFESYDMIITSDIAPLSRVFLQSNWKKPLIVWVCNRFDINVFHNRAEKFPDEEYLSLFNEAQYLENVEVVGYTNYEKRHAELNRGITSIQKIIPPTGINENSSARKGIPKGLDKASQVFVRNYINEGNADLLGELSAHGIKYHCGPYAGSKDLKDFKGMVHIPVVMGNFHLWENLKQGIIHFIPSRKFYKELYTDGPITFWDWSKPTNRINNIPAEEIFNYCDWYNEKLSPLFVFFDSYDHLKEQIETTNYEEKRNTIRQWHKDHVDHCLIEWTKVFDKLLHR
jgi:hypothetical protein